MAEKNMTIELTAEVDEISAMLGQLHSELVDAPPEIRKLALNLVDCSSELVDLETRVTSRASVTVLLKPSQRLLDLCAAVRTGNFDLLVVKHSHGNPSNGPRNER